MTNTNRSRTGTPLNVFWSGVGPLNTLFQVQYRYSDLMDQQRASALAAVTSALGVISLLVSGVLFTLTWYLPEFPTELRYASILGVLNGIASIGLNQLVQRGRLRVASVGFSVLLMVVIFLQVLPFGLSDTFVILFAIPVVASALLLHTGWIITMSIASIFSLGVLAYLDITGRVIRIGTPAFVGTPAETWFDLFVAAGALVLVALSLVLLSTSLLRWARNSQRVALQLEAAAVVSETAATTEGLHDLLNLVVERIRTAYGFYHSQVFLIDQEHRQARLEASTGRAGEELLARGHALAVGSQSVIGQCTSRKTPVVVNDTEKSATHRPNELLPDTRAELALPLIVGSDVIGALDVQSIEPDVFQPEDIRSLQIMAGQLATAIDKARLLDELQSRANENQRLFEEAQYNLQQVEELSRRLTREGWRDYLRTRRKTGGMGYTMHADRVHQDSSWTAPMRQAYQGEQSVVVRQDQEAHIAAVPVRVRGEVIGVLEVERGGDRPWTDDELEMAETLVERLALAIENARLYEQATLAASREQIVNQIGQSVQQAETIDDVLQSALIQLSDVLGASRGVVQITPKIEESDNGESSASVTGQEED